MSSMSGAELLYIALGGWPRSAERSFAPVTAVKVPTVHFSRYFSKQPPGESADMDLMVARLTAGWWSPYGQSLDQGSREKADRWTLEMAARKR